MQEFLFFKVGKYYSRIKLPEILYIHADGRHVTIVTKEKCYFSLVTIGQVEKLLPPDLFCRIHRSYIISLLHTEAFDNELAYVGNRKIPISEQYKNVLKNGVRVIHGNSAPVPSNNEQVEKILKDMNL